MKTTNHTPGPWSVSPYMNITSRNGTIAKTEQMPGNDESEQKANAHLIAAAPDLLSALEECLSMFETMVGVSDWGSPSESELPIVQARAAIAKAEGLK